MTVQLIHLGAAKLANLIANGQATAADAVDQHIAQINKVNPALNALAVARFDAARAEAREADAKQQRGEPLGPLHGVPVTVKECLNLAGTASTFGLESRKSHCAAADETHVARLRAGGAIAIGKTNVSQMLLYYEADNPVYGRSNNPWNLARSPGGSSGGEAALVATGASALGLGSDIGGSVRVPAAFCGISALKPTSGRCDDMGEYWGPRGQRAVASQIGVLAPRTADVALGLQVINGQAWTGAPSCALGDYTQIDVSRLRVAFYTDDGTFSVSPAVARAVQLAAQTLRDAGAQVAAWTPPGAPASLNLFYGILGADKVEVMRQRFGPGKRTPQISQLMALASVPLGVIKLMRPLLRLSGQPSLANALESFGSNTIGHYWQLVEAQIDYQKQFADALDNAPGGPFDIILCPPCALPAYSHGASRDLLTAGAYATLYNLLGYPAGVVPVTKVLESEQGARTPLRDIVQKMALKVEHGSAGLPVGVQVVARPWHEDVALAAMATIEQEARQHADFSPPPLG